jgi:transposase
VSIASVALANGLNANMLRRWVVEAERAAPTAGVGQDAVAVRSAAMASGLPAFVAVQMPDSSATQSDIHIELTRGPMKLVMRWPASLAGACASWLRELLR